MTIFYPATTAQLIADINTANNAGGIHTINLTPGAEYVFTVPNNTQNADNPNALPAINCTLTINGQGAQIRRNVSASDFRFFYVLSTHTLSLNDLTVRNGRVSDNPVNGGGAVLCQGTLNLTDCVFSDNKAVGNTGSYGGAVLNRGTISAINCVFMQNEAGYGGAIDSDIGATSTITKCKFHRNTGNIGGAFGAGRNGANATVTDSQFTNNYSTAPIGSIASGGAIDLGANSSLTVTKSRFQNNSSPTGASIHASGNLSSTIQVHNSFFVNNINSSDFKYTSVDNNRPIYGNSFDASNNWWGATDGPNFFATGHGDGVSDHVTYFPFIINNEPVHTCDEGCIAYKTSDGKLTPNPISLQYGEKRVEEFDIAVNTPAGTLSLTRSYRQNKQSNAQFQFMGLGWTHNHNYVLQVTGTTPNRTAIVYLEAGSLELKEDGTNANHFVASVGSTAELDYNSGLSRYTLTLQNKATYAFDATSFRLLSRSWPNAENWTYTYSSSKLSQIDDGYGRQLNFSYINNPGGYDHDQLWRVGDHTASGLSTGTPSGRYVEYSYQPERNNGTTVTAPKALLTDVRDLLANHWTYDYYGQHVGENVSAQLNFMTKRLSPSVDTTGDGLPDGTTTLESVSYTLSGSTITNITQQRGLQGNNPPLLSTALTFQPGGANITTETMAGLTTIHRFDTGIYTGMQDPLGNYRSEAINTRFRPETQIDAKGNATQLFWSDDARYLQKVIDADGNATSFTYNNNDGTLQESRNAQALKTKYTYGDTNNLRLPTLAKVFDTDDSTVLRWQIFTYDTHGRTLSEQTVDPTDGVTKVQWVERTYYTTGNGNGLLNTITQKDVNGVTANDSTTTYSYDSAGRVVKTQQSSMFGNCSISYTVYDAAGNIVASICNYDPAPSSDPTTMAQAIALFNPIYPDKNRVTVHEYDTLGRRFKTTTNAGASYAIANITVYDGLSRVIRTISNYDTAYAPSNPYTATQAAFGHGSDNTKNLVTDTAYNDHGMVRKQVNVLGNVTLYGYDNAGRLITTIQNASQPDYNNNFVGGDPSLSGYLASSAADQDMIMTNIYDPNGNPLKNVATLGTVTFTSYDVLNRPVKVIRNASQPNYNIVLDPTLSKYSLSTDPDKDMVETTEYDSMGRVKRSQDTLGNWTLYGYDPLGRQIRVVRNASQPNYNIAADQDLSGYVDNGTTDQDLISDTVYDAQGRMLYSVDLTGEKTWAGYDGLGRQAKTVVNATGTATNGSALDPRSAGYQYNNSAEPDKDLITYTSYDLSGRVQWTLDVLGRKTWYVYDDLGRQKKVIQNCTYTVGAPAPESDAYAGQHAFDTAKDIITRTEYDAQGRAFKTIDSHSNETRYVYDTIGRHSKVITNYIDGLYNAAYPDEDVIQTTNYDVAGRVVQSIDNAGKSMYRVYDAAGRATRTIINYVAQGATNPKDWYWNGTNWQRSTADATAIDQGVAKDQNLISTTTYDKGGRVTSTMDTRGTLTTFTYDNANRRLTVIQAAGTPLTSTNYTCYDKGGRVLRTIQNWLVFDPTQPLPDAKDTNGNFLFTPVSHGPNEDQNLVTTYALDKLGRQLAVTDPLGNQTSITYRKDGQVVKVTDPEGTASKYRYDRLRRRTMTVQSFAGAAGDTLTNWNWDLVDARWENNGSAISFGANNDQNIIVAVSYDKAGRMLSMRDPRGNLTQYVYDLLDRRLNITDPLNHQWATTYADVMGGKTRVTTTDPLVKQTQRDFDKLGRLQQIQYLAESPKNTPDITFGYDAAGNRTKMTERDGASTVRETTYSFDQARRLASIGYDNDGNGAVDETVSYEYNQGGLRTKLTLPGGLIVTYTYDTKGQLISLTDWNSQPSVFAYDTVGRLRATERTNGMNSRYVYDAGSRLRRLSHAKGKRTLGDFQYKVDKRGNRVEMLEYVASATVGSATISAIVPPFTASPINYYLGTWTINGNFSESINSSAALKIPFGGDDITLTMGTGPDHSIYDIYIDGSLWQSIDGYAARASEQTIQILLDGDGPHTLEVHNRAERNVLNTTGYYKVRFKQLVVNRQYDLQTWAYTYDALSRLLAASTSVAYANAYSYAYDVAGNRTLQTVLSGSIVSGTSYTYDAANRLTETRMSPGGTLLASFTYNNAGNLLNDGTNAYTWDRANRLLRTDTGISTYLKYKYDGLGHRVESREPGPQSQDTVRSYLLDTQLGLWQVLSETKTDAFGSSTTRYVHGPMGLHAQKDASNNWEWMVQDGLGSIRGVADNSGNPLESRTYSPYGEPIASTGTNQTSFGFTGEPTNGNGLTYLRARYYNPALGQFINLDPLEIDNRYQYVGSNPINSTDPIGLLTKLADPLTGGIGNPPLDPNWFSNAIAAILLGLGGGELAYQIKFNWSMPHELTLQEYINNYFDKVRTIAQANWEEADTATSGTSNCAMTPGTPECQSKFEAAARALQLYEKLDTLRGLAQNAADGCVNIADAVQKLVNAHASSDAQVKEGEAENNEPQCPITVRQIFENPSILANQTPETTRCAFQVPNSLPGYWLESPATGRSGGTKFDLLAPGSNTATGGVQVRWSTGLTERHFNGPYWRFSINNGNPPSLWVAPDGTLYDIAPKVEFGTSDPGHIWSGTSLLPLPHPFQTWAFGA